MRCSTMQNESGWKRGGSPGGLARVLVGVALGALVPAGAPAQTPAEVGNLRFDADKQTLLWDAEPLAGGYNLYRGYLMDLSTEYTGAALEGEIPDSSYTDPVTPVPAHGFFYLVTAMNESGEGPAGESRIGGAAQSRSLTYPWPGRAVAGSWSPPRDWPSVAIHATVLANGKVMTWQGAQGSSTTVTYVWDPASDTFESPAMAGNLFCSGHSVLPDGRLLVTGGNTILFNGPRSSALYDPFGDGWTQGPDMNRGRYYPTNVTLADGRVAVFSGNTENGTRNPDVEIYRDRGQGRWDVVSSKTLALYPTLHLMSNGRIFHSGPERATEWFDPATGVWEFVANTNFGPRGGTGFNSVILPPGHDRVLILGGVPPGQEAATNTAEIMDLSEPNPTWRYTAPLHFPRKHSDAVILPDGTILIAGGGYDETTPVHPAELFDPATETWTVVASLKGVFRLYHSTAVLLPDARVMWAGGTTPSSNQTATFFSPGYLYRGARPSLTGAPATVGYGEVFHVSTPDGAAIGDVVFIRPGSVTHSVNMSQRYVPLAFAPAAGGLDVTAPSDPNVAPPGYYMLFLVNQDGVPSVSEFIRLQ